MVFKSRKEAHDVFNKYKNVHFRPGLIFKAAKVKGVTVNYATEEEPSASSSSTPGLTRSSLVYQLLESDVSYFLLIWFLRVLNKNQIVLKTSSDKRKILEKVLVQNQPRDTIEGILFEQNLPQEAEAILQLDARVNINEVQVLFKDLYTLIEWKKQSDDWEDVHFN